MTTQNLVSATVGAQDSEEILRKLSEIRAKLPFLLSLDSDQVRGLLKGSSRYRPFVEKAHAAAVSNPDILPKVFAFDEYMKDWDLVQSLGPILLEVEKLADALRDTLLAANSDALSQSLEVYTAVKQHQDKVPGLAVAAGELSAFFQKGRHKTGIGATVAAHAPTN
jgi:hypothetical protein